MVINWGAGILNTAPYVSVPSAPTFYVWPATYVIGTARVTQSGIVTATADGTVYLTQSGIVNAQAYNVARVTQVGIIVVFIPPPCVGEVIGQRTDGLNYVAQVPDPCEGTGLRSGIRTGA